MKKPLKWDDQLTPEQIKYASCKLINHSVLIAGPGTGKTYTIIRKIAYMISVKKIPPDDILILTFTRAAAAELRNRLKNFLDNEDDIPTISTLHSFALKQLILNQDLIANYQIPVPIRIVDDWEENNIIFEDLKVILNTHKKKIIDNFLLLSADWDTLKADEEERDSRFEANFLGAWESHRKTYSYILRSELVYQVKKSLEQMGDFKLEKNFMYVLIDEFQDLNQCDLALIYALRDRGSNICGIGDDDQSIYGFRYAYPEGIRTFEKNFSPADLYDLSICQRCDKKIIELSEFIANLGKNRVPKKLQPTDDAKDGEIHLYRFENQYKEAKGIMYICKDLIQNNDIKEGEILILLRNDYRQKFSSIIRKELEKNDIKVSDPKQESILDFKEGRLLISFLRLINDFNDSLALRTIIEKKANNIGIGIILKIYNLAKEKNKSFLEITKDIEKKPSLVPSYGNRIKDEYKNIKNIVKKYDPNFRILLENSSSLDLKLEIRKLADELIQSESIKKEILDFFFKLIEDTESSNLNELLSVINSSMREAEQDKEMDKINILTMHKAKGLTAKAVIIAATEDEYIPGKQKTEPGKFDELRLLYVSISRAKHYLAMTYCEKRLDKQKYTGANSQTIRRHLTEFLRNCTLLRAESGDTLH